MFGADYKIVQRMAPMLRRVLAIDPQPAACKLLSDLLRNIVECQIWTAPDQAKGLALAKNLDPQIIFVEAAGPGLDGIDFTRKLRRSEFACRKAPVIVTSGAATAGMIMSARDAGVHEFLRKPFTVKDLTRRLEAVTIHHRDWIEAVNYVGPDRRRFNSGDYSGPLKRRSDARETPDAARLSQALKILRSAVGAVDSNPSQALRAMLAQAHDIQKAAVAMSDIRLSGVAAEFQRFLATLSAGAPMNQAHVQMMAGPLLAFSPPEPGAPRAVA